MRYFIIKNPKQRKATSIQQLLNKEYVIFNQSETKLGKVSLY